MKKSDLLALLSVGMLPYDLSFHEKNIIEDRPKICCGNCKKFPGVYGGTFCKFKKHTVNKFTNARRCGYYKPA